MTGPGGDDDPYRVPGPPSEWLEAEDWLTDPFARIEERTFPRADTLPGQIEHNKLLVQKAFGLCIPISIILAFIMFWTAVAVYVWNMLAWGWTWLDPHEMDDLKSILFSGAVGAVVAEGARRYLKPEDKG